MCAAFGCGQWISTTRLSMIGIKRMRQLTRKTTKQLQPCLRRHVHLMLSTPTSIEQGGEHDNAHIMHSMLSIIYMLSGRAVRPDRYMQTNAGLSPQVDKTCATCQTADVKAAASTSLCCCAEGDELSICWLSITAAKTCACTSQQSCST